MADLPRSRALVQLDGPGHILPVEPVTPEGSKVWRFVHFPLILLGVAIGLIALALTATVGLSHGFTQIGYFPGGRLVAAALAAAVEFAVYWVFVRLVERRRTIAELGTDGWLKEFGAAFAGGLLLSGAIGGLLIISGAIEIIGFNTARELLWLLVSSLSIAFVFEIVLCGLVFRLTERLVGSWIALAVSAAIFWAAHLFTGDASMAAGLALVLKYGLAMAALYMVTRRLWGAIGLHAGFCFAQIGVFGTTLPGDVGNALTRPQLDRPDWLTGGMFGPDASMPALLVNAALLVTFLVVAARRGRIVRPIWRQRRS